MNADDLHCFCVVVAFTHPGFSHRNFIFDSCCAVPFLSGAFYTFADVRGIEPPWETEQILLLHPVDILQQNTFHFLPVDFLFVLCFHREYILCNKRQSKLVHPYMYYGAGKFSEQKRARARHCSRVLATVRVVKSGSILSLASFCSNTCRHQ